MIESPKTRVRIEIGEIKTNLSERSIASVINQLSIRAALFSLAAHLISSRCSGLVTAKVFVQDGSEGVGNVERIIEEAGLATRKLAPGFEVRYLQEIV